MDFMARAGRGGARARFCGFRRLKLHHLLLYAPFRRGSSSSIGPGRADCPRVDNRSSKGTHRPNTIAGADRDGRDGETADKCLIADHPLLFMRQAPEDHRCASRL